MARMRCIKPGIMTNEDLCELGPYAYILFTSLWMLADREGRLEDRPRRIKAEGMPLWDDCQWQCIAGTLEKLAERQFIQRYEIDGKRYIAITAWSKHQRPHIHEAASVIPPPPANGYAVNELRTGDTKEVPSTTNGGALPRGCFNSNSVRPPDGGETRARENCAPLPPVSLPLEAETPPPQPQKTEEPKPATPTSGAVGATGGGGSPGEPVTRKPAAKAEQPVRKPRSPVDPSHGKPKPPSKPRPQPPRKAALSDLDLSYSQNDILLMRGSLNELATAIRMAPPDDGILRQVLTAARGAPVAEIHSFLVGLWKRNKFKQMYSWGFVPHLVRDAANRTAAAA